MQTKISEKRIAWIILIIFLISLIPLLYISQYIHPSTDDYVFGKETYHIWNNTHSFLQAVQTSIKSTFYIYTNWQGTYSACFLMAMQPGVFNLYWITPFILIGSFIFSNYWLVYLLMKYFLQVNIWKYLIISSTLTLASIQFVPSTFDAFYWYNGAMYYTFYYSMSLILASLIIKQIHSKGISRKCYGTGVLLLSIFLAGGNYMTGLLIFVIICTFIVISICNKQKVPPIIYVTLCIYCISFSISIIAPGNAVRASYIEEKTTAIHAMWISLTYGCSYLVKYTTPTTIALFIFLSPILYQLARNSKYSFKYPWLCILLTYVIYCSAFTPTCYALGFPGYERNLNIYQYVYYWFVLTNLFYLSGAIWKKSIQGNLICRDLTQLASHIKKTTLHYHHYAYLLITFLFVITVIQSPAASKRVLKDIISDKAPQFDQEMKKRITEYTSDNQDITFYPLSNIPTSIYAFDLKEDPGHWINQGICLYYKKHSVKLVMDLSDKEQQENKAIYQKEVGPGNLYYKRIYCKK